MTHSNDVLVRETRAEVLHTACLFHLFSRGAYTAKSLKWSPDLNISHSVLPFLCVNRQTQDHRAPLDSRSNYLEKAAMLQVQEGMLITLVDTQDASFSFSFVQSLYGLINYETIHR